MFPHFFHQQDKGCVIFQILNLELLFLKDLKYECCVMLNDEQ